MSTKPQHAFIDEYGNTDLDTSKPGVSTHFIVTAVIVDSADLETIEIQVEEIRKKFFQTGEIKSSSVGKDSNRREKILFELSKLNFHFYCVVTDKREISADSGLIYKRPFLKFLNNLLFRKLFHTFPEVQIVADEHGSAKFMDGFKKYVNNKYPPDLFRTANFNFLPSHLQPLIQVADFISGTIARAFDPTKASEGADNLLKILKKQALGIEEWPPCLSFCSELKLDQNSNSYDAIIREQSLFQALLFIQNNQGSSDETIGIQLETIKYLLFYFKFIDNKKYVLTKKILKILTQITKESIKLRDFRSKIIAKLKDNGVIISSRRDGYKIPTSIGDIHDFVEHTNGKVQPMLDRLAKVRNKIRLASKGQLDILDQPKHSNLKKLLDVDSFTKE